MSAAKFLAKMREGLGARGRPNVASRWYAARNGSSFATAPWCDMRVTWAAYHSGTYDAVCFGTDYAYTVYHAQRFQAAGRWHWGASGARPGDVVFFDWNGARSIGAIDHVGVVEKNLGGGRLQTIEGNTGDALLRRVRSGSIITGYGRPDFTSSGSGTEEDDLIGIKKGSKGEKVKALQVLLGAAGCSPGEVDGDWGPKTSAALLKCRKSVGSEQKAANELTGWAYAQVMIAVARKQ